MLLTELVLLLKHRLKPHRQEILCLPLSENLVALMLKLSRISLLLREAAAVQRLTGHLFGLI